VTGKPLRVKTPEGETALKKFNIIMVSIGVLAAVVCRWAPAARADDKQEISDLEHKIATVTTGDEAMKYYDSEYVLFDVMGPPREFAGQKALHDHNDEFSGYKDVKVDFLELQVISDGKLALARSVQHYAAKDQNGKPIESTFRQTDVWRKTNGQWKLIHTHVSYPIDMKTGKADMASKM
jgi:ketosteroid isomerase-like protein